MTHLDKSAEEINKLSALMCLGERYEDEFGHGYYYFKDKYFWEGIHPHAESAKNEALEVGHFIWNPCDPNSNQIQTYLIPALFEKAPYDYDNKLRIEQLQDGWHVAVILSTDSIPTEDDPFSLPCTIRVYGTCDDITQLNKTIAAAILEAAEIIKGENNGNS